MRWMRCSKAVDFSVMTPAWIFMRSNNPSKKSIPEHLIDRVVVLRRERIDESQAIERTAVLHVFLQQNFVANVERCGADRAGAGGRPGRARRGGGGGGRGGGRR